MAKRHVHVPDEVILGIAGQVEELLWAVKPAGGTAPKALTVDKRKALFALFALLAELLSDDPDQSGDGGDDTGPDGSPAAA